MFPFHLKVASKKGAKKDQNNNGSSLPPEQIHPFYNGGPLQRAIRSDLQVLYETFAGKIQVAGLVSTENNHLPAGFAFQLFRETAAKLALLHTRFCPPRVDENAYSQLLYASCLSLLKDAFQQQQQGPNMILGSFAVFALYALFETNPLPASPPTTAKEQLGMLPMGLINKEKNTATFFHVYRRSFRRPVRIDQEHYGYLVQLRDLALVGKAFCEQGRMKQRQKLLLQQTTTTTTTTSDDDDDDVSSTASSVIVGNNSTEIWTCNCCVATDVPLVIARLVPNLEFCAYTGPCGLEALAGHADYNYPPTIQAYQWLQETKRGQTAAADDNAEMDLSVMAAEQYTLPKELGKKLDDYLLNKRSIRVPAESTKATQKTKRAREAIMPMFAASRNRKDLLVDLSDRCKEEQHGQIHQQDQQHHTTKRVRVRHYPSMFGAVMVPDASTMGQSVQSFVEEQKSANMGDEKGDEAVFELVFPTDLAPGLEESLKAAVETLVERDEHLSLPLQEVVKENNGGPLAAGDISTLGGRGVSIASAATDVGRNALNALLARATNGSVQGHTSIASNITGLGCNALKGLLAAATGRETAVNDESSKHMSALEASRGAVFLGVSAFEDEATESESKVQQEETSYMSDLSSDEDQSVTGSTVGRAALRDLLSIAKHYQGPRKRKSDSSTGGQKRLAKPEKRQASNGNARQKKRAIPERKSSEDEGSSSSEGERSQRSQGDDSGSSGAQGHSALNALLQQAAGQPGRR